MKILLPVDGSRFSTRAVNYVINHLQPQLFGRKPQITLLHVDPPMIEMVSAQISPEDVARYHDKNSAAALRGARRMLDAARLPCRERRLVGEPGPCIARVAKQERSDLIVMGSHGRGALKSLLLGSVVTKTLAQTRTPLLIVR